MVKAITKIGNSQGLIFDTALLELARLKAGDQVNITVHRGGAITLTPLRTLPPAADLTKLIKRTMKDYHRTMKRLA